MPPENRPARIFSVGQRLDHGISWGDAVVLVGIGVFLFLGAHLAKHAPDVIRGPYIALSADALPWYAAFSIGRMLAAYILSVLFTLVYGYSAAHSRYANPVLLPILDVLQSVPILSFLPVVLLGFSSFLPLNAAVELASIVLIFTSQVWNMTFAWYQSLTTIPKELEEACTVFRFNGWFRFKTLQAPFAAISFIWNSIMSWAGGWFFLMAAEIFTVGRRDFRLPGLGAYLHEAASQGDIRSIACGIGVLILIIVGLDQLVWRPLLTWAERFKLEMVEADQPRTSWFYDALRNSRIFILFRRRVLSPAMEALDLMIGRAFPLSKPSPHVEGGPRWTHYLIFAVCGAGMVYSAYRAGVMLSVVPLSAWMQVGMGLIATMLRVSASLLIALAWTLPLGVAIGSNPRLANLLQPVVQITASMPATALFPVFVLFMMHLPGGLNLAAVLVMLLGAQWYLLFNIIAGAATIPQDLKYMADLLNLKKIKLWKTLILPSLFPYIITGAIAASGGAWNASIVAEHAEFAGETLQVVGIGSLIARATSTGDYPLLLAATLSMVLTVVLINRLIWRRLYRLAQERYRME
jgi:NitT/TauT family transport system permease protein